MFERAVSVWQVNDSAHSHWRKKEGGKEDDRRQERWASVSASVHSHFDSCAPLEAQKKLIVFFKKKYNNKTKRNENFALVRRDARVDERMSAKPPNPRRIIRRQQFETIKKTSRKIGNASHSRVTAVLEHWELVLLLLLSLLGNIFIIVLWKKKGTWYQ